MNQNKKRIKKNENDKTEFSRFYESYPTYSFLIIIDGDQKSHTKLKRFLRPLNGPYSVLIFWRHKLPTLLIKSL